MSLVGVGTFNRGKAGCSIESTTTSHRANLRSLCFLDVKELSHDAPFLRMPRIPNPST